MRSRLQPTREEIEAACAALPLFPLPDVVFLPHTVLPLHVFEPRYRALVADCLQGNGMLAVPRLRTGWERNYHERPAIHSIAGFGRIARHQALEDGRWNILVAGLGRVRIDVELEGRRPYRVARATLLDEGRFPREGVVALRALALQVVAADLPRPADLDRLLGKEMSDALFVDMLAHVALRDADDRQRYLEAPTARDRLAQVTALLAEILAAGRPVEA